MDQTDDKTTRRRCLRYLSAAAAGAVMSLAASLAPAFGRPPGPGPVIDGEAESYDIIMARVRCEMTSVAARGARWNIYPGADTNLLEELSKVVRCRVKLARGTTGMSPDYGDDSLLNAVVGFDDGEELRRQPLLFLTGEGHFTLSESQRANLKRALTEGGFLLIDDCVLAPSGDTLFQSAYKELETIFGKGAVVRIPKSHEVFHNVYDLGAIGLPHCQGQDHGARGVFIGDRLAVFLSSTDLHCGWADRNHIWFPNPSLGKHGYKEAIEMGVNILMYAMSH